MAEAKIKQMNVFTVIGSLKISMLRDTNTIIPTPNPIRREGHNAPSNAFTKWFTDFR